MTEHITPVRPPSAPRRRPRWRLALIITVLVLGAFAVLGAVLPSPAPAKAPAAVTTVSASPAATHPAPASPASSPAAPASTAPAAADTPAPADTPTDVAPTKITFVVSGYAPGDGYGIGPSIDYGTDSDNYTPTTPSIDGTVRWSVPFSPDALYYALTAQLGGTGHLTCKIVISAPGYEPVTVATGHASGGYSICSAQAASDDGGLTWYKE